MVIRAFAFILLVNIIIPCCADCQSDTAMWRGLFHSDDTTEIVFDEYVPSSFFKNGEVPQMFVDTLVVERPSTISRPPSATNGLKELEDSTYYPLIAQRAGVSGKLIVHATIDSLGTPRDVTVEWSTAPIFNYGAIKSVQNTKFKPAIAGGMAVASEILIAMRFVWHKRRNPNVDTIMIETGGCLGPCPAHSVTLASDGSVVYFGNYNVERMGRWRSKITTREFQLLTDLLFALGFFKMPTEYATGVTDLSWITINVKTPMRAKTVRSDYYAPLWEFAHIADLLTDSLKWEKVEK